MSERAIEDELHYVGDQLADIAHALTLAHGTLCDIHTAMVARPARWADACRRLRNRVVR